MVFNLLSVLITASIFYCLYVYACVLVYMLVLLCVCVLQTGSFLPLCRSQGWSSGCQAGSKHLYLFTQPSQQPSCFYCVYVFLSMYICLRRGCTSCALGCGTWVLHQCLSLLFPALCFLLFEAVFLVAQTGPELCVAYNYLKLLLYICLCVYTCMYRYAHTFMCVEA